MNKLFLYCIKHQSMERAARKLDTIPVVHVDGTDMAKTFTRDARVIEVGYTHSTFHPRYDGEPPQGDWCKFDEGWATTPPPELEQDWIEYIVPPSDDELEAINLNAIQLMADCDML